MVNRKNYDEEYKAQAVKLAREKGGRNHFDPLSIDYDTKWWVHSENGVQKARHLGRGARTALDKCTDSKLYVAMNLSFACSLRMGEILGGWDNVHISEDEIAADNAY